MGNQNSRLLLEAASSGSVSQLKSVLGKADVNTTDQVNLLPSGLSPDNQRALYKIALLTTFLIGLQDGWSALHFSAWAGRLEVLEELLKHGPDVNLQDKVSSLPHAEVPSSHYYRILEDAAAMNMMWCSLSGWKDTIALGSTQGPGRCCGRPVRSWRTGQCC